MCGIAGFLGSGPDAERSERLARMTLAIAHRGPDDFGHWVGPGLALGMRRLSIIDLAGGHQPMWREDGIGIVFNGEIYNFKRLRDELERDGYVFKTRSDTEVILHLYHRDGLEGVRRLEGMFAIALFDGRNRQLHLIRDRIGVKPLYIADLDGRFLFASEIKAILEAVDRRPELNLVALNHFLTLRYVPAPQTIWKGVFKLLPATILTLDLDKGTRAERRYWEVHFRAQPEEPGRDYVKEFETLFLASVDKRLLAADVPVGVFLSGGLDSSAVSMAASMLGHRDLHTFTVAFDDGGIFDETGYARQVAERFGTRHHEVRVGQKEMIEFLPRQVHHTDEPLADLTTMPLYYLSRLARQHVKAVLSGEGSDEILAGYDLEQAMVKLRWLRLAERAAPRFVLRAAGQLLGRRGEVLRTLGEVGLSGYARARALSPAREWPEHEKRLLWRSYPDSEPTESLVSGWYARSRSPDPLDQAQDVLIGDWLVEDLLMKADKMSMAASLEAREPFLDHALIEWAATLPAAWKVGDRRSGPMSKRVLREFCRRGGVPPEILTREKRGFVVPAYQWIAGPLNGWARGILCDPQNRIAPLFRPDAVDRVLRKAQAGDGNAARGVWALLIAEHWLRHWT
jgi:asparagine synthase (glutamine-hydrolysing)